MLYGISMWPFEWTRFTGKVHILVSHNALCDKSSVLLWHLFLFFFQNKLTRLANYSGASMLLIPWSLIMNLISYSSIHNASLCKKSNGESNHVDLEGENEWNCLFWLILIWLILIWKLGWRSRTLKQTSWIVYTVKPP